jgi:hypothetical protein
MDFETSVRNPPAIRTGTVPDRFDRRGLQRFSRVKRRSLSFADGRWTLHSIPTIT